MRDAVVTLLKPSSKIKVSEMILGQNIEAAATVIGGMLSERLSNPKFLGPANPQTGVAPGWQLCGGHSAPFRCELTEGLSMSGNTSQMLHSYQHDVAHYGIVQTGISVRKGEKLELEMWAKCKDRPINVVLSLSPLPVREPLYDKVEILVNASYWKPYHAVFTIPEDNDEALFKCFISEGMLWIDQIHLRPPGEGVLCKELIAKIASLKAPTLRFPGGCTSTNYHWKHGTGPAHLRPDLMDPIGRFKEGTRYDFGTDEYLEMCHAQGISPFITVNIGSGTPEEAGGWATYCAEWFKKRGLAVPPAYFQMGNEHYGVWESSHMTAKMYVETLMEFVPLVRKAYPEARIVALGEEFSSDVYSTEALPWRKTILDKAMDLIDVLVINRYKGQWGETDLDKMINVAESIPKVEKDLLNLIQACRGRGLKTRVGVTEWNYWQNAMHYDGKGFAEPDDVQHGLYVAGTLNMYARLGEDMEVATFYHLVNAMGIFNHFNADVKECCVADVFRLYRPALPGCLLPLKIHSPRLGKEENMLDAVMLQSGNSNWLFAANRSPSEPVRVSLNGFHASLKSTICLAASGVGKPLRKIEYDSMSDKMELPPLSLIRFEFTKQ